MDGAPVAPDASRARVGREALEVPRKRVKIYRWRETGVKDVHAAGPRAEKRVAEEENLSARSNRNYWNRR
jgi:hypothetical protein